MKRSYHGSCHCGAVKYSVTLDLAGGTGKCNCTYCSKIRNWSAGADPSTFKLLSGDEALADYGKDWGEGNVHHRFCKHCGVQVYGHGHIPEKGADFLMIQMATLDDASIDELVSGQTRLMDGRNDNWMQVPAYTRTM